MILQKGTYTSICLYDMHLEGYTAGFRDPKHHPGFARPSIALDFYRVDDELKDLVTLDAKKLVEAYPNVEPAYGCLYVVSGQLSEHLALFIEFSHSVEDGPQGADDDTFDYWPGAMEMFEDYAHDLKALGNDSVYAVLRTIARRNKDVSEWEEEAERLMNLEG